MPWQTLTDLQKAVMLRQGGRQEARPTKKGNQYEKIRNPSVKRDKDVDGIPSNRSQRIIAWRKRLANERRYAKAYLGGA